MCVCLLKDDNDDDGDKDFAHGPACAPSLFISPHEGNQKGTTPVRSRLGGRACLGREGALRRQ